MSTTVWSHPVFGDVAELIAEWSGLVFPPHRWEEVERATRHAMERCGNADLMSFREVLSRRGAALDDLVADLTIGETHFFRDRIQFDFIRQTVLPEIRQRRLPDEPIRVWSAACASGEEAYSLAILFKEEGLSGRVHILATDISRPALAKARAASYGVWSLRGVDDALVHRYFHRSGDRFVLRPDVRSAVSFERINLLEDRYPSMTTGTWAVDLILCRNVMIYFAASTVARVARRLFDALREGGWLILGASDPPVNEYAPFEAVVTNVGVFYRRRGQEARERSADRGGVGLASPLLDSRLSTHGRLERGQDAPPGPSVVTPLDAPIGREPASVERAIAIGQVEDWPIANADEDDPAACARRVRALANVSLAEAERVCSAASRRSPLSVDLHYLHAVLLMELGRQQDAIDAVRRVIYLDGSLAVAHFTLGAMLRQRGDSTGARRAYRNARDLAGNRPPAEPVLLGDGEIAGRLADAAAAELDALREMDPEPA